MTQNVAVPRDDTGETIYHEINADACDTEHYIIASVETAYSERALEPCDQCNPPIPENKGEHGESSGSTSESQGGGEAVEDRRTDSSHDNKSTSSTTEAQWGSSSDGPAREDGIDDGDTAEGESAESGQRKLITEVSESESVEESPVVSEPQNDSTRAGNTEIDQPEGNRTPDEEPSSEEVSRESGNGGANNGADISFEESLIEETKEKMDITPEAQANGDSPHLTDRVSPREAAQDDGGVLNIPSRTQDLANFEYVLGEDDKVGAERVNQAGMIVLDRSRYAAIASVEPREWSVLKEEGKEQIINTFKSAFLSPLDSPVQIVEYPSEFDISEHLAGVIEKRKEAEGKPETNPLIQAGRRVYPKWLTGFIERNGMKQRKFYMIVTISEDQINQFEETEDGLLGGLRNQSSTIDGIVGRIKREENDDTENRKKCLRELDTRMGRLQSGLTRLGVDSERLQDRDEVLEVIYEYYNNSNPRVESFETEQITTAVSTRK